MTINSLSWIYTFLKQEFDEKICRYVSYIKISKLNLRFFKFWFISECKIMTKKVDFL